MVVLLGVSAAGLLGGCVATETAAPERGVIVRGPPPAPFAEEERPAPPAPTAVWVAGYWHWTGQYTWIPGHWESAPPGTAWAPPRYRSANGAYYYEEGAWKPADRAANAIR
jgi:hypothetical protein